MEPEVDGEELLWALQAPSLADQVPDGEACGQAPLRPEATSGPRVQVQAHWDRPLRRAASTSGRLSAAYGAQPEMAGRPPGPGTVEDTFQWPLDYAHRLETAPSGDHWAEVRAKFSRGLRLTSCYSGVGQFETAASWIEKAVEATGTPIAGGARSLQGSDSMDLCQRVLLSHGRIGPSCATNAALSPGAPAALSPEGPCVFGDMLDRRTPEHADAWARLQRAATQRADAAVEAGQGAGRGRVQCYRLLHT